MMYQEVAIVFRWWFIYFVVGLISFPVTYFLFKRFIGLGYALSKTIGFLIITYLIFFLGITHLAPLDKTAIYLVLSFYLAFNGFLFIKVRKKFVPKLKTNLRAIIISELLFTVGFLAWTAVRGFQPDIAGLEKFMDFGFINSILKSRYLPPGDMWFAGNSINYYWFGHFYVAISTKLTQISPSISFNLMLATILGSSLVCAFAIIATLVKKALEKVNKKVALAAGLISAILVVFAGNFHAPIYIFKAGSQNYWYPNATRFIGYHPETNDKTIHEFPIYSFVVSDLHAHLINLPFVLLYIALLASYLIGNSQNRTKKLTSLIPLGFVLGVMFMTSTWDFGNYLLVSGVSLTLTNLKKFKFKAKILWLIARDLLIILLIALLTALPFILNFTSLAEGIRLVTHRTPLWQLGVLWGFPAILTIIYVALLYKLKKNSKTTDIFVLALLLSSWILIAIPEIVFVKDIYIATHQRANTMFKLTYQAYVMTYLSSGYIIVRTLSFVKKMSSRSLLFVLLLILLALVLTYPSFAIRSYYGELKVYRGLSGETWLKNRYPFTYEAILWLRKNVSGQPTILEAPGDSYTDFNAISSYTGFPTISGWYVHEWLWRGSPDFPQKRVEDILQIYTSPNIKLTKFLLEKYDTKYVIVGTFEHQKYPYINEAKFSELGTVVFSSGDTKIYKVN